MNIKLSTFIALTGISIALCGQETNYLKNSGFENINEKGFPDYWVPSHCYKGEITVIKDSLRAYRGNNFLKVSKTEASDAGFSQESFLIGEDRNFSSAIWAKGNGEFRLLYCLYHGVSHKFLGSVKSSVINVNSEDQWKRYDFTKEIPETFGTKSEKVMRLSLLIIVEKGNIFFDEASLANGKLPAAEAEASPQLSEEKIPQLITAPYSQVQPVIDGILKEEEWKNAAAVTGFKEFSTGQISPYQTTAYASYDKDNLYIAFKATVVGKFLKGSKTDRDAIDMKAEMFELWIKPPGSELYQFCGIPAGGFFDKNNTLGTAWNGNWKYASHFEDSGEMEGGVLTFNKTYWSGEISIPFKNLNASCPADGDIWQINFCRDRGIDQNADRALTDWTTWSALKMSFNNAREFSQIKFMANAPAVQILETGDPTDGLIAVSGNIYSTKKDNISLIAESALSETGKILNSKNENYELEAGQSRKFKETESIKINLAADVIHNISIFDKEGKNLLSHTNITFTCRPSFDVRAALVYTKKIVDISIDAERVANISEPEKVKITTSITGTDIKKETYFKATEKKTHVQLDASSLAPGDYSIKSTITGKDGNIIISATTPFTVPPKPVWLGNDIGKSDKVPLPWNPVETKVKTVTVTQRAYDLSDNGLPEQITVLGEKILNSPITLKAKVEGKELIWNFEALKLTERKDSEITYDVSGSSGPLHLKGNLKIEYDGFSLLKFQIFPDKEIQLDSLSLEIPLKKRFGKYVRAEVYIPENKSYAASLDQNAEGKIDIGNHGTWQYSSRWTWGDTFVNDIWVGNNKSGLAITTESDENIIGGKYAEFLQDDKETLLKINLISTPISISSPLKYEYALQATPVRPETKDAKTWHTTYGVATWSGKTTTEMAKRQYAGTVYHLLKPTDMPSFNGPAETAKNIKTAHKYGIKVLPDFYLCSAARETPEFKMFGNEWQVQPISGGWSSMYNSMRAVSFRSSYSDLILFNVKKLLEDLNLDGIYIDVSGPQGSTNEFHNAGYIDRNGIRRPTADLWAARELYKRLYTYLHTEGRKGIILGHISAVTSHIGFVDVFNRGEEWSTEKSQQYKRLSPEMFRAREMRTQYGVPFIFYAFHQYVWRAKAFGTPVPFEEIVMMCLPHRMLPLVGDKVSSEKIATIWDLMDPWITSSEFIIYNDPDAPVKSNDKNILASIYLKKEEKQALIVVSNWAYAPQKARIEIDWQKLGLTDSGNIKITEEYPEKGKPLTPGNVIEFELAPRTVKAILVSQ